MHVVYVGVCPAWLITMDAEALTMEVSQHWRLRKARYSLVGSACGVCGAKSFPAREVCPVCGAHRGESAPDFASARKMAVAGVGVLDRVAR